MKPDHRALWYPVACRVCFLMRSACEPTSTAARIKLRELSAFMSLYFMSASSAVCRWEARSSRRWAGLASRESRFLGALRYMRSHFPRCVVGGVLVRIRVSTRRHGNENKTHGDKNGTLPGFRAGEVRTSLFISPPPPGGGGMVLATSRKTSDKELPLGDYSP